MFDFGNDDKEKLRENMEQIKQMVDQGETMGEEKQPDQEPGFPDEEFAEESSSFEEDQPQNEQPANFDSQEKENFQEQPAQTFSQDQKETGDQQTGFEEEFGAPEDQTPPDTPPENQQRSKTTKSGMADSRDLEKLSQEVPSPPESKEINVPEIDRGPLFLRREKFQRAKQMIDEMLYLTGEIEETVNSLEAGIQEDQRTERDIREMLKNFEDDRSSVEDIISPREE